MKAGEIKAVFDRTFNGMPNPIFCHPVEYFEHHGYLCEVAVSATGSEMAKKTEKELNKTPLAIFNMMLVADCGLLTVLTADGQRTMYGGPFRTEEEREELLSEF